MKRVKLDENLGERYLRKLDGLEIDVASVRGEELSGAADTVIFDVCRRERRTLVTLDLDFSDPLHFPPSGGDGTVVLRPRVLTFESIEMLIDAAIARARVEPPRDAIWIVEPTRIRIYKSSDEDE